MTGFWTGFIVGTLIQATIGTFVAANIEYACRKRGGCWFIYGSRKRNDSIAKMGTK